MCTNTTYSFFKRELANDLIKCHLLKSQPNEYERNWPNDA